MEMSGSSLATRVRQTLDPFGIVSACWEVQRGWLGRPSELLEESRQLLMGAMQLQHQTWRRVWGLQEEDLVAAVKEDARFRDPIWTENPYLDALKEYYLLWTRWLEDAIFKTPDVSGKTRRRAAFWVRQALNATAPTNFFWTNPAAVLRAYETGGESLVKGLRNLLDDLPRGSVSMVDGSPFRVGQNLATTPGAVVYRNDLFELIQYRPSTDAVHGVPILFVPPWINKYYIFDLAAEKSLIRHMVAQGFTVFAISWKNPGPEMRDVTLDDYMLTGALEALEVAREISGGRQVHPAGYCIGGTLVAALVAWLNRERKKKADLPVGHWSVFTTLVDFADPGEIEVLISEDSVEYLERKMAREGYLDGGDMAASFRMLRSNSLIWHYFVRNYLHGETPPPLDVLYWNMDTTRMPQAMHAFYLRAFYLENKLSQKDGVTLGGRPIDLGRIAQPAYVVGTEQDHIAPWKATFKLCSLVKGPVRYALSTSGHILGIINPPVDPPKRRYRVGEAGGHEDPETWRKNREELPGTWWGDWIAWLRPLCGEQVEPPSLGTARYPVLAAAPGSYVLER